MKTKEQLHNYWQNPNDKNNSPEGYLDNETTLLRSKYLYEIISKHFTTEANILELGSNVGRNLNYLYERGYKNLTGVEINENAIKIMTEKYPECYKNIRVIRGAIEDAASEIFSAFEYDLIISIAVLEHIHPNSEWIFDKMISSEADILTIENEVTTSDRHCPRNYFNVFGKDMKQIEVQRCGKFNGLSKRFVMRLFTKGDL